jgi:hypothetical protein
MHAISYVRHRFPPRIIDHAVWLYLRFTLSYRDVEDLLAARGRDVSYETVRRWVLKFGPAVAQNLRHARPKADGRWHLDAGPMPMHERLGTNDREHLQDRWTPSIERPKNQRSLFVSQTRPCPLRRRTLSWMSERRIFCFKPALRLEWRHQDGQNEAEQREHCELTVGDSFS